MSQEINTRLPSLNALQALVLCAKTHSISKAAQLLHRSQGAISRQIKQLEEMYGIYLFEREPTGLTLTKEGRFFLENAQAILDKVSQLETDLSAMNKVVLIKAPSTFAMQWLFPKLDKIQRALPDYIIKVDTSADDKQRQAGELGDVSSIIITRDSIGLPFYTSYKLFSETLTLMCSPALYQQILLDREVVNTACKLRILPNMKLWNLWLAENGFEMANTEKTITFDTSEIAMSAAADSLGVALLDPRMAASRIAHKSLVIPFSHQVASGKSYFMNIKEKDQASPAVVAIKEMILGFT
ncbi:LysR family transcriptional regulator [Rouxiella badensis]|uniref:LysR family transcriptional regulator n=1 Tax=Rouxiella badensis TaxID=1646377 RepID=UPI001B6DAF40|nr:LysR family transcriptional regulator [Rouxiella badensis]MCC3747318.1 LysR family transcriptional regulator [Rouxiella badensis]